MRGQLPAPTPELLESASSEPKGTDSQTCRRPNAKHKSRGRDSVWGPWSAGRTAPQRHACHHPLPTQGAASRLEERPGGGFSRERSKRPWGGWALPLPQAPETQAPRGWSPALSSAPGPDGLPRAGSGSSDRERVHQSQFTGLLPKQLAGVSTVMPSNSPADLGQPPLPPLHEWK